MQGTITDDDRSIMLRAAVSRVGREEMKAALASIPDPGSAVPKGVRNALGALRRHRDPVDAVARAPYRTALPYVAAAISDACLSRSIEELGDASDDPTREQLLTALDRVRDSYADLIIAVMLASVAGQEMPASDLCFEILATDPRYGLTDRSGSVDAGVAHRPVARTGLPVTSEQREARRLKKHQDAEERRKKMDAGKRAGEQLRRTRKQGRSRRPPGPDPGGGGAPPPAVRSAPRLTRRAALTPVQQDEFDRDDPWVTGVLFAWVPFGAAGPDNVADPDHPDPDHPDPDHPELDGKERPCVVVAGSPTHLLVRPGYSDGGSKSRDWTSVPLRHWKRAGFDRPTWIATGSIRVRRDQGRAPVGWLTLEDWNALW